MTPSRTTADFDVGVPVDRRGLVEDRPLLLRKTLRCGWARRRSSNRFDVFENPIQCYGANPFAQRKGGIAGVNDIEAVQR